MNVIGEFRDYESLHDILRRRAEQLELSRENIDDLSGMQDGYAGKILCPNPKKKIGSGTFHLLLPALAIRLVAVSDDEALARLRSSPRAGKRDASRALHAGTVEFKFSRRHMRKIQRRGGLNSRKYMEPARATELARHANRVRWGRS